MTVETIGGEGGTPYERLLMASSSLPEPSPAAPRAQPCRCAVARYPHEWLCQHIVDHSQDAIIFADRESIIRL
jgi:hypothetical protein